MTSFDAHDLRDASDDLSRYLSDQVPDDNRGDHIHSYSSDSRNGIEWLRRERLKLEHILDATEAATWEWNVQTGETIFNERWASMLGYTLDELQPVSIDTWQRLAHPDDLKQSAIELEKLFRAETSYYSVECRMRHRDGHWIWVQDRGKVVSWSGSQPVWVFGTHIDITLQKQQQLLLLEQSRLFDHVLASIQDGIAVIGTDFTVWHSNDALQRWCGHELSLAGQPCYSSIQQQEQPCGFCLARQCLDTLQTRKTELQIRGRWVEAYFHPMLDPSRPGQAIGFVEFIRDIDERKRLELAIIQRDEQSRLLISQMQHGLALHEIIVDASGQPVNYRYLDINPKFEEITGLRAADVVGRTVLDILPETEPYWIEHFGRVALGGEPVHYENYSAALGRWFRVTAYSPRPGQFAVIADDITDSRRSAEEITAKTAELERFFTVNLDLLCIADLDGRFIKLNKAWEQILGYDLDELEGSNYLEFVHPEDLDRTHEAMAILSSQHDLINFTNRYRCRDGSYRYIEWRSNPYGNIVYAAARDITDRVQMENQLNLEKELFRTTLLSVGDGVVATDSRGVITMMNKVAEDLTGWTQADAAGLPMEQVFRIINEMTRLPCPSPVEAALASGEVVELANHTLLLTRQGREIPIEDSAAPIRDREGRVTGVVIVFRDFTEKRERQRQIEYLSYRDALTGLYNRRYLEDSMARLDKPRSLPLTIMVLDVNGLKLTNDAYGHAMGDLLLKTVANMISKGCRATDIISRSGGDEFVILLPNTDADQADRIKQRIISLAARTKLESVIISLAVGYAVKTDMSEPIDEIKRSADNRMYQNKLKYGKLMRSQTVEMVLRSINNRYDKEQIHTERVSQYCEVIARAMGLGERDIDAVRTAGVLHDIGKILVPAELLNKPDKLDEQEMAIIRRHPETGYQILRSVDEYAALADIVLNHHEHWDGQGYPKGTKGKNIPLEARIIAVADAYEAMTSQRSYQQTRDKTEALEELKQHAGSQFDPAVVACFVRSMA